MIYIEEKKSDRHWDVLKYFCSRRKLDLVIWLYPESKLRTIGGLNLTHDDLIEAEQVTTYEDELKPLRTDRVSLTEEILSTLRESSKTLQSNAESIVLYPSGQKEWIACIIGHEGIIMVRDHNHFDSLMADGFNPSLVKPEWW